MKETEDDSIANKIRQVFDDFEDLSAEQGWKDLRKKYPETNRRPILIWMGSAAALLMIATAFWFLNYKSTDDNIANEKLSAGERKIDTERVFQDSGKVIIRHQKPPLPVEGNLVSSPDSLIPSEALNGSLRALIQESKIDSFGIQNKKSVLSIKDLISQVSHQSLTTTREDIKLGNNNRDSAWSTFAEMSLFTLSDSLKSGSIYPVKYQPRIKQKSKNKGLSFSFYAGSFYNYAKGSEIDLNFGGGFSSDINISKNMKFSTGLNLANNKLSFDQNIPGNADKSFQSSISSGNTSQIILRNYKAELLSLDIPVNIKYTINPDKNDLYILAGLSSGTYLQETYGAQLQTSTAGSIIKAQEKRITKQFEHFDLARTLNVSFGFSTRLTKTQKITIEPFLKYPLGGLGTENIKFGSSGINVKLNVNSLKK